MTMTAATMAPGAHPLAAPKAGLSLWGIGILLAMANFLAVLDITIANVSVPTIAGNLGASSSQGTWVITSYAVAEAIMVPLTGWLASRFGAVKVFITAMLGFGFFSAMCGLAGSLDMLVLFRVLQGFCGGPMLPLSQTLLMHIFPKEKQARGDGALGDDDADRADRRPDPRRHPLRQFRLALDLLGQRADRR